MTTALLILAALALAFIGIIFLAEKLKARPVFSNIAEGSHEGGRLSRSLENAFASRYLLAKQGTADTEIDLCGASDLPLGVCTDEGAADELVNLQLLGSAGGTVKMTASEAITAGTEVYTAANGKVSTLSVAAGDYYRVGIAVTAAGADGDLFEVDPYAPLKVTVA